MIARYFIALFLFTVVLAEKDWFDILVEQQTAEVIKKYPQPVGTPTLSPLEICGGVDETVDPTHFSPRPCEWGKMKNATAEYMIYVRIVFTPLN